MKPATTSPLPPIVQAMIDRCTEIATVGGTTGWTESDLTHFVRRFRGLLRAGHCVCISRRLIAAGQPELALTILPPKPNPSPASGKAGT